MMNPISFSKTLVLKTSTFQTIDISGNNLITMEILPAYRWFNLWETRGEHRKLHSTEQSQIKISKEIKLHIGTHQARRSCTHPHLVFQIPVWFQRISLPRLCNNFQAATLLAASQAQHLPLSWGRREGGWYDIELFPIRKEVGREYLSGRVGGGEKVGKGRQMSFTERSRILTHWIFSLTKKDMGRYKYT